MLGNTFTSCMCAMWYDMQEFVVMSGPCRQTTASSRCSYDESVFILFATSDENRFAL